MMMMMIDGDGFQRDGLQNYETQEDGFHHRDVFHHGGGFQMYGIQRDGFQKDGFHRRGGF